MIHNKCPYLGHRQVVLGLSIITACLGSAISVSARSSDIPAVVSTDWLAQKLTDPHLIVLDIRNPEQYRKGHIPGAVNMPFNLWAVPKDGLTMELPSDDALRDLVLKAGIDPQSEIVVVNRIDSDFSRADPMRVAWTLHIAGVDNTAILDGGYNRWVKEKRSVSTDVANTKSGTFAVKIDRTSLATKAYVLSKLRNATIIDARVPEEYFGVSAQPGHIRNAVNLPTPWMFDDDGAFRKKETLEAMAIGVLGTDKSREMIFYCGVGGYASTWWFLLTRMFGYQNVKVYDGSMEEWLKDASAPVSTYTWR